MKYIKALIKEGKPEEAILLLEQLVKKGTKNDEVYYQLGNAYRKLNNVRLALNNYLEAIHLNPDSPAKEAHDMLIEIMDFYNKDMYNQ